MLLKIKQYSESNLDKIIIATGDTDQLETITQLSNKLSYETYSNHCIDKIFHNIIFLKINKRLKSDADKETLKQFKLYIF